MCMCICVARPIMKTDPARKIKLEMNVCHNNNLKYSLVDVHQFSEPCPRSIAPLKHEDLVTRTGIVTLKPEKKCTCFSAPTSINCVESKTVSLKEDTITLKEFFSSPHTKSRNISQPGERARSERKRGVGCMVGPSRLDNLGT